MKKKHLKKKQGKKAKTKTLKCGKTWNCSLKYPSKSQEKLTKSTSKFLQRKKVNSMAEKKKIYQYLGKKMHRVEENMKSPLEFSTARL